MPRNPMMQPKAFRHVILSLLKKMQAKITTVRCMKEMLSVSHLCFPNYTEACLLTDSEYKEEGISEKEAYELIDKLRAIGSHSVLIS